MVEAIAELVICTGERILMDTFFFRCVNPANSNYLIRYRYNR